jgi:predicted phosphodiesterase
VHALRVERREQGVLENRCEHAFGSDKREILAFAKREKPRNLIDFRAGQNHSSDRAVAHAGAWLQRRRRANLRGQIGRAVDENPVGIVAGNCDARLCARTRARITGPSELATRATTIPLRKTAPRRRTKNNGAKRIGQN